MEGSGSICLGMDKSRLRLAKIQEYHARFLSSSGYLFLPECTEAADFMRRSREMSTTLLDNLDIEGEGDGHSGRQHNFREIRVRGRTIVAIIPV